MVYDQLMQTYLGVGLLANRPAAPNVKAGVGAFYYATDTAALYVWDGAVWHTLAGGSATLAGDSDVAITSPTDGQVLTYAAAAAKWQNKAAPSGGASTLTAHSAHLAATVTSAGANSWVDGPSVALDAGTWLVIACINTQVLASGGACSRIWDGTTTYASMEIVANSGWETCSSMVALITLAAPATIRAAAACNTAAISILAAINELTQGNNDSTIVAIKIA